VATGSKTIDRLLMNTMMKSKIKKMMHEGEELRTIKNGEGESGP